ncbi:MAG: CcmD family protein [Actinobacteria bacterium]|nr:CcmD family protein [Actinomycetota bacterium]
MMSGLWYLAVGYGVMWLGLFGYLVYVAGRVRAVRDELAEVQRQLAGRDVEQGRVVR